MDIQIPSNEMGEPRCSDLEVPLFTTMDARQEVIMYIQQISHDQWTLIENGQLEEEMVVLLTDMCNNLVTELSELVLEEVAPQSETGTDGMTTGAYGRSYTSNGGTGTETPQRRCSFDRVTDEDMQASLGNALYRCFGAAMGVEQENSLESNMLLGLVAAEMRKKVNQSLAASREATSSLQSKGSAGSELTTETHFDDMVFYAFKILRSLRKKKLRLPEAARENSVSFSGLDKGTDIREGSVVDTLKFFNVSEIERPKTYVCKRIEHPVHSPVEEHEQGKPQPSLCQAVEQSALTHEQKWDLQKPEPTVLRIAVRSISSTEESSEQHRAEEDSVCQMLEDSVEPSESSSRLQTPNWSDSETASVRPSVKESTTEQVKASLTSAQEEAQKRNKTFFTVFLGKLVDHVAHSTKTSIFEVDFDGMVARLAESIVGEMSCPLPQTVGNIHIPVYKDLCKEFGSAMMVQPAMASGDEAFDEAVTRLFKEQLQKSSEASAGLATKVKRLFHKNTAKVTDITSAAHSGITNVENGSKPASLRKKKRPVFVRMFSSAARIFKKPCTCSL